MVNKLIIIILILIINNKVFSLEITVPIKIYENLSKNTNSIIGSSTIVIEREEFSSKTNKLFHEILETNSGIKSRSLYGSSSSGSKPSRMLKSENKSSSIPSSVPPPIILKPENIPKSSSGTAVVSNSDFECAMLI